VQDAVTRRQLKPIQRIRGVYELPRQGYVGVAPRRCVLPVRVRFTSLQRSTWPIPPASSSAGMRAPRPPLDVIGHRFCLTGFVSQ
jgi:hypothetical protein